MSKGHQVKNKERIDPSSDPCTAPTYSAIAIASELAADLAPLPDIVGAGSTFSVLSCHGLADRYSGAGKI